MGALIIGVAEQMGFVYAPTYSIVLTFLIMAAVLAFRPQGLLGRGDRTCRLPITRPASPAASTSGCGPSGFPPALVDRRVDPAVAADLGQQFRLFQIFGWTFILGMIGLSLMFLAGYGGMVSLLQMSIAGVAGYMVAILGTVRRADVSLGSPGGSCSRSRS